MIKTFKCKETEEIWKREFAHHFSKEIQKKIRRRLLMLDAATTLLDLQIPPANRLEKLKGDRKNQYSIRVNDQWRICFKLLDGKVVEVEAVDYHS